MSKKSPSPPPAVKRGRGRPPKLDADQAAQLVDITREQPLIAVDDIIAVFRKRTGITLAESTVKKYLRAAGVGRSGSSAARRAAASRSTGAAEASDVATPTGEAETATIGEAEGRKRYGYNDSHRDPGDTARYPCGLTDAEWETVREIFEPGGAGREPKYARRSMLDACIYVLRSGAAWRMMPKEMPPWHQAYKTFRRWAAQGLFERMYDQLRALWRAHEGRQVSPTGAVLDSQSVKTSPQGGPKGYDGGKKIKGRKRHLITDTLGLLLVVLITPANVQDRDATDPILGLAKAKYATVSKLYVDGGYAGKATRAAAITHNVDIEVVRHPANRNVGKWTHPDQIPLIKFDAPATGFQVLPKRWVVERNNAWNERPRRLNRDHDRLLKVSTAWIWLTEARMLLRRLTTTAPVVV